MKPQTGSAEKKTNKPSGLLSPEENEQVFALLGRRCQSMCTAVAKLFTTEGPSHSVWIKRQTGALCFVRDSSKRSYFIRLYCLIKSELVWEEEMYDAIYINQSKEWLLDFEGRDSLVALDFASELEASSFYKTATTTIANRSKRRQVTNKRRSRRLSPPTPTPAYGEEEPAVTLRRTPIQNNMPLTNVNQQQPQQPASQFPSVPQYGGAKHRKNTGKKLTTADISMPTGFKHVVHVGWTAQNGFDLVGNDPNSMDSLNQFLKKAGVSEQELSDRKTRAFIYDFIESNKVLELEGGTGGSQGAAGGAPSGGPPAPPPVPSRQSNGSQRTAPPPPPPTSTIPTTRQPPPPLPKTIPQKTAPPVRPPPMTNNSQLASAPPPPPPPPPPPMMMMPVATADATKSIPKPPSGAAAGPDKRDALLESIRGGISLKKVNTTATQAPASSSLNLLHEIRQGKELRPAAERELRAPSPRNSGGGGVVNMAQALRQALEERQRAIGGSSDESDGESSDNDWDA